MPGGFGLGKVFGIQVNIHWSWIFIFLLITWNLSLGVFPTFHPDWSPVLSFIVGLGASILFFLSVLAHELAHSLIAKRRGIAVNNITLFLFGGVSDLKREPPSPDTEFSMAIIGPLTSILLGVLFLILSGATAGSWMDFYGNPASSLSQLSPLSTLLVWLGPVNILVGLFNLIPGFPLDGGRVLRAAIWGITKDFRVATHYASLVGQVVAWSFILTGISMVFGLRIPLVGTGLISGLWLAFIGVLLNGAAAQSYEQVLIEDILKKTSISKLMNAHAPAVSPDISANTLVYDYIMGTNERAFPVIKEGKLIGLVSLEDVRKVPVEQWNKVRVGEIMTPFNQLETTTSHENVARVLNKLNSKDIAQLPVMENGKLIGMICRRDILLWLELHTQGKKGKDK